MLGSSRGTWRRGWRLFERQGEREEEDEEGESSRKKKKKRVFFISFLFLVCQLFSFHDAYYTFHCTNSLGFFCDGASR